MNNINNNSYTSFKGQLRLVGTASNKIKTAFIVSLFIIAITFIIYSICMAFDLGYMSIIIALAFSIITSFASYYNSDKIILSMSHARPATHEENQKLVNILDALVISGLAPSKGQAKILVTQGGITLNDNKIDDISYRLSDNLQLNSGLDFGSSSRFLKH